MIEIAAYSRAQARAFAPGGELQDWLEAEAEIDASLRTRRAQAAPEQGGGEEEQLTR